MVGELNTKTTCSQQVLIICLHIFKCLQILQSNIKFYLHTVKWFQVSVCNTNNLTSVICLHIVKWLNSSILSIHETLTGTTTPGQSGAGINGNERVFHFLQSSRTGTSPSDAVYRIRTFF